MPSLNKSQQRPWDNKTNRKIGVVKKDNFYNNQPWRKLRFRKLTDSPLCEISLKKGIIKLATMVDHTRPRRFYPELELCYYNLQSLSHEEHQIKRAKERHVSTKEQWEELAIKEGWI